MMKKNRIATRVKDKTGIAKSKNRSEELGDLRVRYGQFSKNLKFLISTLNGNLEAMRAHSRSRLEVAKAVNALTVDTPLFKCAGDIPSHAIGTTDGGPPDDGGSGGGGSGADAPPPASYAAVHLRLHKKNKAYGTKYAEHIVAYATEWERILTTRITRHLKEYDKLRVDLDHYGRKVEDINKTHNKTMSKGKSVQEKGVDKLRRNEQKLVQARQEYDRFVNDLCTFLEEVLERGWKDLLPLLVKMGQFDATLSNEEHGLLRGSMAGVTAQMTEVASRYPGLNSQGRLKELETSSLESLARAHPSEREFNSGTLAIAQAPDAGDTGLAVGGGGLFGSLTEGGSRDQLAPAPHHGALSPLGGAADNPPRSRADTGDSGAYDWAAGGPVHPPTSSAPTSGNGALMGMPRTGSGADVMGSSQRMSSGSLSALRQDLSAQGLATGAMLATMGAAAPAPTLDDVFASSQRQPSSMSSQHSASRGNSSSFGADAFGGAGAANPPPQAPVPPPMMPPGPPPPPPSAAPPAPPQAGMAHMSLYPPAGGSGASAGSSNPFDDAFGGGGGGGRAPSSGGLPPQHSQLQQSFGQAGGVHSAPSTGGLPPQQQQMMYGGQPQQSFGSGASSTNPFG